MPYAPAALHQCRICHRRVNRRPHRPCLPCERAMRNVSAAHLAGGDSAGPPHPEREARIALYAARAALRLPLFTARRR